MKATKALRRYRRVVRRLVRPIIRQAVAALTDEQAAALLARLERRDGVAGTRGPILAR